MIVVDILATHRHTYAQAQASHRIITYAKTLVKATENKYNKSVSEAKSSKVAAVENVTNIRCRWHQWQQLRCRHCDTVHRAHHGGCQGWTDRHIWTDTDTSQYHLCINTHTHTWTADSIAATTLSVVLFSTIKSARCIKEWQSNKNNDHDNNNNKNSCGKKKTIKNCCSHVRNQNVKPANDDNIRNIVIAAQCSQTICQNTT